MTPIATHDLVTADGRAVTVEIYAPEPDPQGDWRSMFRLTGALDVEQYGHGVDTLQALVNALQGARKYLDDSGLVLTWNGAEPGEHWVPYQVPQSFGRAFEREIIDEIDRRVAALVPKLALFALRSLTQRIAEGAPRDELAKNLDAIESAPGSEDRHVKEALRQARSMLDAARP